MLEMHIRVHLQLVGKGQDDVIGKQVSDDHGTDRLRFELERRLCCPPTSASLLFRFAKLVRNDDARVPGLVIGVAPTQDLTSQQMREKRPPVGPANSIFDQ